MLCNNVFKFKLIFIERIVLSIMINVALIFGVMYYCFHHTRKTKHDLRICEKYSFKPLQKGNEFLYFK